MAVVTEEAQAGTQAMEDDQVVTLATDADSATPRFSIPILSSIKEAQRQHGLRHSDYQRYRQYCSRRLHRLRTSLNFMCGRRNYVKNPLTLHKVKDARYLYIPLVSAERCWAYAQQLKHEARSEDYDPRKLQHMQARLAKAVKHATLLEDLANSDLCDPRTGLEAKAYSSWMQGNRALEAEDWQAALQHFNLSKVILTELGSMAGDEARAICIQRVADMEPHIRYCTHTLGLSTQHLSDLQLVSDDLLVAKIEMAKQQEHSRMAATIREVTWFSRVVPVPSERLMAVILQVLERQHSLEENKADPAESVQLCDKLLSDIQDAKDQLNDERRQKNKPRQTATPMTTNQAGLLQSYLDFVRLWALHDKNVFMIEQGRRSDKFVDLLPLYTAMTQCLNEISRLPGVEEDAVLCKALEVKRRVNAVCRQATLSRGYLATGKWAEAAAVADNALRKMGETQDIWQAKSSWAEKEKTRLSNLANECRRLKLLAHASMCLPEEDQSQPSPTGVGNKQPGKTLGPMTLIALPPDPQPVACKPLFFDLGLDMQPVPDLRAKAQHGLTGYLKSWVWGR